MRLLTSKKALTAIIGIVVALLFLVPFIPDSSSLCAPRDCPISPRNPPLPYVSATFFVSGIGTISNGGQFVLVQLLGRAAPRITLVERFRHTAATEAA